MCDAAIEMPAQPTNGASSISDGLLEEPSRGVRSLSHSVFHQPAKDFRDLPSIASSPPSTPDTISHRRPGVRVSTDCWSQESLP